MKVLILALNYAPELIGSAKYTAELARWLAARGHEVRVIAAPPYYPAWRVAPGYAAWRYRRETLDGVEVLRCPVWVPAAPSAAKRMLHLASFALSSALPCLWQGLRWRPDLVWTVEPTGLGAPAALMSARLAGGRACLHVQDLEIEAAFQLGMLGRVSLARVLRASYAGLLRHFDLVSTISERMRTHLAAQGVSHRRLCLFPNWVDTAEICPLARRSALRRTLGISDRQVVALYAGNMGEKQGLELLAEVVGRLADNPVIRFVLCGDGAVRGRLEQLLGRCSNVVFLPLQPSAQLNELLNMADIHLLPQRAEAECFALPSKLGGMLASGRPVVVQAAGGELVEAATQCGVVVPPGDATAMARAVLELACDAQRRSALGKAARRFATTRLERDPIVARYERRLAQLTRSGRAAAGAARAPAGAPAGQVSTAPRLAAARLPAGWRQ